MSKAEDIVDRLLDVVNASPRTPSRSRLLEVVHEVLDTEAPQPTEDRGFPAGTQVQPLHGAMVFVQPNMSLTIANLNITSPRPLTVKEASFAILEWMRVGLVKSGPKP